METGKLKNWVMIGLLGIIIIVLLTQPIIVTESQLTAWTTDDGLWSIGDVTRVDDFLDYDIPNNQYSPDVEGDIIVFSQVISTTRLVAWFDIAEEEYDFVYNVSGTVQDYPKIHDGVIVWCMKMTTGSDYDVWMKNLETNHTTQLTNSTDDEMMPILNGDAVVYIRDFSLWCHDLNNATNYQIYNATPVYYIDMDGDIVAFSDSSGDLYYYDFDTNTTTDTDVDDASFTTIEGDIITYQWFDDVSGKWTISYYSIDLDRDYTLNAPDNLGTLYPDVYDGIVVSSTTYAWSGVFGQITIVDLDHEIFGENFVQLTNYTTHKVLPQIDDHMIVWEEYEAIEPTRATSGLEHDVVYLTYSPVETIPHDYEQQTTYQIDWVYTLIIMLSMLGAVFTLWLNEEYSK